MSSSKNKAIGDKHSSADIRSTDCAEIKYCL